MNKTIAANEEITNFLIKEIGMRRVSERTHSDTQIDWNKFSCVIRTGDIHYLFWTEHFKSFSIGVMHENPKGKAGGGFDRWTYVMIPKVINSIEKARAVIEATIDEDALKYICQ